MRRINKAGLELIKRFEGCKVTTYKDIVGILTIGYGHTGPDVTQGQTITLDRAEELLQADLERFYHLDEYLSEQVNDNQYSALICLAYNIGLRALKLSTLIKCINNGDRPDKEWMKWNHAGGKVVAGLTRRREAELELYNRIG